MFVECFNNKAWKNCFYIYLCLFSRLNDEERLEILLRIKSNLDELKNYIVNDMKLTMHKKFDKNLHYRYAMVFESEEDLMRMILCVELHKIDDHFYDFFHPFEKKNCH